MRRTEAKTFLFTETSSIKGHEIVSMQLNQILTRAESRAHTKQSTKSRSTWTMKHPKNLISLKRRCCCYCCWCRRPWQRNENCIQMFIDYIITIRIPILSNDMKSSFLQTWPSATAKFEDDQKKWTQVARTSHPFSVHVSMMCMWIAMQSVLTRRRRRWVRRKERVVATPRRACGTHQRLTMFFVRERVKEKETPSKCTLARCNWLQLTACNAKLDSVLHNSQCRNGSQRTVSSLWKRNPTTMTSRMTFHPEYWWRRRRTRCHSVSVMCRVPWFSHPKRKMPNALENRRRIAVTIADTRLAKMMEKTTDELISS